MIGPHSPQSFNWSLVGITLGACLASVGELFICIYGNYYFSGAMIRSRLAAIDRQQQSNVAKIDAEQQARQRAMDEQYGRQPTSSGLPSLPPTRSSLPTPSKTSNAPPAQTNTPPEPLAAPFNSRDLPQDSQDRDWKDRSGGVIFHGHLQGNYGTNVRLTRRSGGSLKSIVLPAATLANEDQEFIKRFPVLANTAKVDAEAERARLMREAEQRAEELRAPANLKTPMPAPDPAAGQRTWTDSTGKFKIDAELIAVENGNVKLQRPDGKIVTMAIVKLSPADQALVRGRK